MKEYKLVYLNRKMKLTREADIKQAEEIINEYVSEGWNLQQVITPTDLGAPLVGVFYKEN